MIVLDASVVLEVLLGTPAGRSLESRIFRPEETWHAPHLLDLEVLQVLRRYRRSGELSEERAQDAIGDLADFPLHRYPHDLFLPRIWQLKDNLTAYDACYLALAETLDAPLLTRDRRLAAAPGHGARVELV